MNGRLNLGSLDSGTALEIGINVCLCVFLFGKQLEKELGKGWVLFAPGSDSVKEESDFLVLRLPLPPTLLYI